MGLRSKLLNFVLVAVPLVAVIQGSPSEDEPQGTTQRSTPGGTSVTWTSTSVSANSDSVQIMLDPSADGNPTSNRTDSPPKKTGDRKLSAYFPNYNADARPISDIRYDLYDELSFFVAETTSNFTIGLGGFNQTYWDSMANEFVSRCKAASVTPSYSLGGWTGSRFFSSLVATAANRTAYAQSAVSFARKYGFEGIDIDWEYPIIQGVGCNVVNDADVTNYQLFMKEIKTIWPEGKLTSAVSIAGIRDSDYSALPAANLTLLVDVIDTLRIMAYDVYGSWSQTTGPHAPFSAKCADADDQLSVETAIAVYRRQGFNSSQLSLGIPGYARSWTLASPHLTPKVVQNYTSYYYQNFTAIPAGGEFDDKPGVDVCGNITTWGGTWLVSELVSRGFLSQDELSGASGYTRYADECSGMPFLASNSTLISYDDTASTVRKVQYAKAQNLSGVFFFDSTGPLDATVKAARHALLN